VNEPAYPADLVPGDTNAGNDPDDSRAGFDVFVRDRAAGLTERVSVGLTGQQGNGPSAGTVSMSNDGRIVVFSSRATNLVPGDYGDDTDVYLRDLQLDRTERVSVHSNGAESTNPSRFSSGSGGGRVSGDGRFVSFSSSTDLAPGASRSGVKVYVHEVGGTDYWAYAVLPSKADFGARALSSRTARWFTVTNSSTQPLTIAVLELRGADKLQFRRTDNCPVVLPVDTTCTVEVRFEPNSVGTKWAVLKVVFDTGATRPVRKVTLTGTGVVSSHTAANP
jgi:hypothetical protein